MTVMCAVSEICVVVIFIILAHALPAEPVSTEHRDLSSTLAVSTDHSKTLSSNLPQESTNNIDNDDDGDSDNGNDYVKVDKGPDGPAKESSRLWDRTQKGEQRHISTKRSMTFSSNTNIDDENDDDDDDKEYMKVGPGNQMENTSRLSGLEQKGGLRHRRLTTARKSSRNHRHVTVVHKPATIKGRKGVVMKERKRKRRRQRKKRRRKKKKSSSVQSGAPQGPEASLAQDGDRNPPREDPQLVLQKQPEPSQNADTPQTRKGHIHSHVEAVQKQHHAPKMDEGPERIHVLKDVHRSGLKSSKQSLNPVKTSSERNKIKGKGSFLQVKVTQNSRSKEQEKPSEKTYDKNVLIDQNLSHEIIQNQSSTSPSETNAGRSAPTIHKGKPPNKTRNPEKHNTTQLTTDQHGRSHSRLVIKTHPSEMSGSDRRKPQSEQTGNLETADQPINPGKTVHLPAEKKQTEGPVSGIKADIFPEKAVSKKKQDVDQSEKQMQKLASVVSHYASELSAQQEILNQIIHETEHAEHLLNAGTVASLPETTRSGKAEGLGLPQTLGERITGVQQASHSPLRSDERTMVAGKQAQHSLFRPDNETETVLRQSHHLAVHPDLDTLSDDQLSPRIFSTSTSHSEGASEEVSRSFSGASVGRSEHHSLLMKNRQGVLDRKLPRNKPQTYTTSIDDGEQRKRPLQEAEKTSIATGNLEHSANDDQSVLMYDMAAGNEGLQQSMTRSGEHSPIDGFDKLKQTSADVNDLRNHILGHVSPNERDKSAQEDSNDSDVKRPKWSSETDPKYLGHGLVLTNRGTTDTRQHYPNVADYSNDIGQPEQLFVQRVSDSVSPLTGLSKHLTRADSVHTVINPEYTDHGIKPIPVNHVYSAKSLPVSDHLIDITQGQYIPADHAKGENKDLVATDSHARNIPHPLTADAITSILIDNLKHQLADLAQTPGQNLRSVEERNRAVQAPWNNERNAQLPEDTDRAVQPSGNIDKAVQPQPPEDTDRVIQPPESNDTAVQPPGSNDRAVQPPGNNVQPRGNTDIAVQSPGNNVQPSKNNVQPQENNVIPLGNTVQGSNDKATQSQGNIDNLGQSHEQTDRALPPSGQRLQPPGQSERSFRQHTSLAGTEEPSPRSQNITNSTQVGGIPWTMKTNLGGLERFLIEYRGTPHLQPIAKPDTREKSLPESITRASVAAITTEARTIGLQGQASNYLPSTNGAQSLNAEIKPKRKTHEPNSDISLTQQSRPVNHGSRAYPNTPMEHPAPDEGENATGIHPREKTLPLHNTRKERVFPLPLEDSDPFAKFSPVAVGGEGNRSALWMVRSRVMLGKEDDPLQEEDNFSTPSQTIALFDTDLVGSTTLVTSLGVGTTVLIFSCFLGVCGLARWCRHRQYRKTFNKMEQSFSGLDTERPVYLRLCRLRRCQAGNQFVVTIVDDSKFSVVEHDLESEDEIFDITDIRTADKKGPLSRLQWTNQSTPY